MGVRGFAAVASVLGVVAALVVGCSTQSPQTPSSPASSSTAAPRAKIDSLIDPQWMGYSPSQPWNWEEMERGITPEFQRFGFRPFGEIGGPRFCQGCGQKAVTAEVTVYAPGRFDPTYAKTGQPVDVNGHGGFLHAATWEAVDPERHDVRSHDAALTWQYADNSWATVQAMTPLTASLDRMLELARALRPTERTPIRVPLSLANVPKAMPLAGVHTINQPIMSPDTDFGTTLDFGPCTTLTRGQDCAKLWKTIGSLRVQILHRDDFDKDRPQTSEEVDWKIGGKDGRYVKSSGWAGLVVQKGVYVQFDMKGPKDTDVPAEFEDILSSVEWAPDPGNDATWRPISDWVK